MTYNFLKYTVLFVGIFLTTSFTVLDDHESYLSVTQINYNEHSQSYQCEMKVTAHDLEKSLKIISGKPVILDKKELSQSNNKILSSYLKNHFSVKSNQEKISIEYVGYEVELDDNAWIYFEFKLPANSKFKISNTMLTETFSLQQNVIHLKKKDQKQSFVFTKYKPTQTFNWNE